MRSIFVLAAVLGCSAPEPHAAWPPPPRPRLPEAPTAAIVAPGLRLPDDVTPLRYALRLEVDPDADTFKGSVAIRVRLERPVDHFWIHADELVITRATAASAPLAALDVAGDQMQAFGFGRTMPAGPIELAFEFTGHMFHDQQGVFRQRDRGRWYLYTQSESVFARKITPCFDEPRFKTPWQVTLVVPHDAVALANMPQEYEHVLPDGRRELAFDESPPLPSYLLAFAVGPFELVPAGTVGKDALAVRVAALRGDRNKVGVVAKHLPAIVDAIEAYTGDALPWRKLDLVAVPHFFGAMENSGLVTFDQSALVGDPGELASHFTQLAAHEVAHHWFGNLVTPSWWDELWLAEASASWLGDKVTAALGLSRDPALDAALARERAIEADSEPDARPLGAKIAKNADPEAAFGAISYEKGQTVLATFEHFLGEDAFRNAQRSFLAHHRTGTATARDLVSELGGGAIGVALASYVEHAGIPVVELAVRCDGAPVAIARVRDGRTVPVCVRDPAGHRTCAVVGARAEIPLSTCPAWLVGNDGGLGYYDLVAPRPPLTALSAAEKIAAGDDTADALARGDISVAVALADLTTLARSHDPYAQHAAAAIAHVIDPLVDDATRPAWGAWLAARFADRLTPDALLAPRRAIDETLRDDLVALVPADRMPAAVAKAARVAAARDTAPEPATVTLARDPAICDRLATTARTSKDPELADALREALGGCGADRIDRALEPITTAATASDGSWSAIAGYFARGSTRAAAWRAVRTRVPELLARATAAQDTALLGAVATLCDPNARAEVAATFEPRVDDLPDGHALVARTLALIDRCVARRARLGDLAAALK